jgi:hypothetical protein
MVVGTAPDALISLSYRAEKIIAANGGVGLIRVAGLLVDVLATTAYICRFPSALHEQKSILTWTNYHIESIYVDEKDGKKDLVKQKCKSIDLTYDQMWGISEQRRNEIVYNACGLYLGAGTIHERVSTGFFALCLAVMDNPETVCIVGLGLSKDGHADKSWGRALKQHALPDFRCLEALLKRYNNFVTTSKELNERLGVPIV